MKDKYEALLKKMIEKGHLPSSVYKMRAIDDRLINCLEESKLWFSNPKRFNDPFDCGIDITVDESNLEHMEKYYSKYLLKTLKDLNVSINNIPSFSSDNFRLLINKAATKIKSKKGIGSFLSNKEHLLMWAHYANSHTGVCLKFDIKKDLNFFSPMMKVHYTQSYPIYDYITKKNNFVEFMFFTKSIEWEYEGELRVLKESEGYYHFVPESLVEITFGCQTNRDDVKKIINLTERHYPNAKLLLAKKNSSAFKLDFELINKPDWL